MLRGGVRGSVPGCAPSRVGAKVAEASCGLWAAALGAASAPGGCCLLKVGSLTGPNDMTRLTLTDRVCGRFMVNVWSCFLFGWC